MFIKIYILITLPLIIRFSFYFQQARFIKAKWKLICTSLTHQFFFTPSSVAPLSDSIDTPAMKDDVLPKECEAQRFNCTFALSMCVCL